MISHTSITHNSNVRNLDSSKLDSLISCLQKIEPKQNTLRNRPQISINIPDHPLIRSLSPHSINLAAYTPREIQSSTPKLSNKELTPQSFMLEPIQHLHLEDMDYPLIYLWKHPELNGQPELIIDISFLESTEDQPDGGDSSGIKMRSLHETVSNSSHQQFYVKHTSAQHAFAQKGTEKLYNLLFESTGLVPVPENFLCFDLENLDKGIIGIASRINPHLVTLEGFSDNIQRLRDNYDETANKMLEALEPLHRILGNHDVHQDNVMIEINPETQEPTRPQILDLGDTFIFWEKGIPVEKARSPLVTNILYGPFIHLEDRQFTENELKPLEKFVSCRDNNLDFRLSDSRILSIVNRYFCGSAETRNNIAHTIQARINSTYSRFGLKEDDEYFQDQRSDPERYNHVLDNHVFRY